jgi:hypothetical protein
LADIHVDHALAGLEETSGIMPRKVANESKRAVDSSNTKTKVDALLAANDEATQKCVVSITSNIRQKWQVRWVLSFL